MSESAPHSVSWRVLLLRKGASELLVFRTESGLFLPSVEIPAGCRTAPALNSNIKARWGLAVYSLYPIETAGGGPTIRYHLIEALHPDAEAPPSARWVLLHDARLASFSDSSDSGAVQTWLAGQVSKEINKSRPPFVTPGWFPAVQGFVQAAIRPLRLTGAFLQYNASPSFSLIRLETEGPAVWFKAVGEPNAREFPLTVFLSVKLPVFTPRVLASEPLWNAWLMPEIAGVALARTKDPGAWFRAARDLARMQIASMAMTEGLLACAPRDVRTEALLVQVKPFFALMREWMNRQAKPSPPRLTELELEQLACDTQDALLALQQERIPDTLGHLDLNPENVITADGGTVFLDWAEGCVGHPFLSFAHFLEYFLRTFGNHAPETSGLIRAYLEAWHSLEGTDALLRTLSRTVFLAIFAHAVSSDLWRDDRRMLEPATAGYYRSLARRMKRYRDRAREGVSSVSEMFV
ncbi:MAG: phosphotransferase [Candidatus Acidiferrum sp.]|jgi:hypothetical protein